MTAKESPMQKIISKCWQDEEFKKRLVASPNAVLAAEGVAIPDGVTVKVCIDTEQVRHLVIPIEAHIDDSRLDSLAGSLYCGAIMFRKPRG